MLKNLFGKHSSENTLGLSHGQKIDVNRIKVLIEFFPVGKKLRYYPEFNQDIVFDTIVVAYSVNGHHIYSMDSIEMDRDGFPSVFRAEEGKYRLPVDGLKIFQLLLPDTSDMEMKLDYVRRAQLSRNGQFGVGNSISLISKAGTKGVSTIDTEVAKQVILRDGPYAHMNLVLLTPDFDTLQVSDQRDMPRTKTNVSATMLLPAENYTGQCVVVDISDTKMRICLDEHEPAPVIQKGDVIIIDLRLSEAERHYAVNGSVIRFSAGTCVIALDGLIQEGRPVPFAPLDLLEFKAGLLNYGR
jgi:hypothetical protein